MFNYFRDKICKTNKEGEEIRRVYSFFSWTLGIFCNFCHMSYRFPTHAFMSHLMSEKNKTTHLSVSFTLMILSTR